MFIAQWLAARIHRPIVTVGMADPIVRPVSVAARDRILDLLTNELTIVGVYELIKRVPIGLENMRVEAEHLI